MRETSLKFAKSKISVCVALKSQPIFAVNKTTGYSFRKKKILILLHDSLKWILNDWQYAWKYKMYKFFNPAFFLFNICFNEIITYMKYIYVQGRPPLQYVSKKSETAKSHNRELIEPISVTTVNFAFLYVLL